MHQLKIDQEAHCQAELMSAATALSREEFCRLYDHLFLSIGVGRNATSSYATVATTSSEQPIAGSRIVAPLRKRAGTIAFSFITIGRAPSSDVVIAEKSVSKCHAMVYVSEGHYWITDARSKFGLRLNGDLVLPGQRRELQIEDEISFSSSAVASVIDATAAYFWYRALQKLK